MFALLACLLIARRTPHVLRVAIDGVDGAGKTIALSFDDGPDPASTPRFLDVLDRLGWTATFFVLGDMVRRNPALVVELLDAGHEVALHGDRHRSHLRRTPNDVIDDLRKGYDTIADVEASGLPAGLGPRLTGTPTAAGEFQVSLTVTTHHLGDGRLDSCAARTATKAYTLRIDDSPALCDSSTECAFLVSGFGGEACSSSRACPRGSACVRTGDAGRCHQSDSNVICGSGTRRLRTATIEGDLVETCVSDNKARKQCNERRHCVDAPLGSRGTPCEVGIECATFSCFAGRCE